MSLIEIRRDITLPFLPPSCGRAGTAALPSSAPGAPWWHSVLVCCLWGWSRRTSPLGRWWRVLGGDVEIASWRYVSRSLFFKGSHGLYVIFTSSKATSGSSGLCISCSAASTSELSRKIDQPSARRPAQILAMRFCSWMGCWCTKISDLWD